MKAWFQRVLAILCLATGLACLLAPFRDYATEEVMVDTIGVDIVGFAEGQEQEQGEAGRLWKVEADSGEERYPGILEVLDEMTGEDRDRGGGGMRLVRTTIEEAAAFFPPEKDEGEGGGSRFSFVYRDHVFRVNNSMGWVARTAARSGTPVTPGLEATMNVERVGRVLPVKGTVALTDDLLAERPKLDGFLRGEKNARERDGEEYPSWPEWRSVIVEAGGEIGPEGKTRVVLDGKVLEVERERRISGVKKEVPGLGTGVKVAGSVLLVIGVILLVVLYRSPHEEEAIQVGSPGYRFLGDVILILISALAAVAVVDFLLGRWFGVELLVNDEFGYAMSAFFLAIAVPLVSLYQASAAAQHLWVDEEGLRLKSLFSDRRLSWERLEKVRCKRVWIMTARVGAPLPRTLSRNLVLEGGGEQLSLMEPSKAQKHRIIRALLEQAPEQWKGIIEEVGKEWDIYVSW